MSYDSGGIPENWKPSESPPFRDLDDIKANVAQMLDWKAGMSMRLAQQAVQELHAALEAPRSPAQPDAGDRRKVARRVNSWGEPGKRKTIIDRRQQPMAEALLRELVACDDAEGDDWPGSDSRRKWLERHGAAWSAARAFLRGGSGG